VERKITARTKAILVQHTYGFPAPIEEIRRIADARGIAVIEDCCHTFGGKLSGKMLGTFGAAAFFSGQWNKPFSTGLGGLALVQDEGLARKVRAEQARYPLPGAKSAFMLASQILVYELFIYPRSTAMATEAFRWLTKRGIVVGSSSNAEFDRVIPENYALRPARVQCELAEREIARIDANMRHRVAVTRMYNEALPGMGYAIPKLSTGADVVTIRYPLRVANKDEAIAKAASYGVEIGSWFEVPLHPAETNMRSFGYEDGCCPAAERVCREVINLPTHRRMSESAARQTLEFVRKVCRPVK
jgi:dTDP-4-amino-4,6-dideoxygalactose transaminase